jgi:acyl-CoA dehydrogenase
MIRDPARLDALLADIRAFVRERWHPLEDRVDREGTIPPELVEELRRRGYFGWSIPEQ